MRPSPALARLGHHTSKSNPVLADDKKCIESCRAPRFRLDVASGRIDDIPPPLRQLGAVRKKREERALNLCEGQLKLVAALALQIVT